MDEWTQNVQNIGAQLALFTMIFSMQSKCNNCQTPEKT